MSRVRIPPPRWRCTIPGCADNRWHHMLGALPGDLRDALERHWQQVHAPQEEMRGVVDEEEL